MSCSGYQWAFIRITWPLAGVILFHFLMDKVSVILIVFPVIGGFSLCPLAGNLMRESLHFRHCCQGKRRDLYAYDLIGDD